MSNIGATFLEYGVGILRDMRDGIGINDVPVGGWLAIGAISLAISAIGISSSTGEHTLTPQCPQPQTLAQPLPSP